MTKPTRKLRPFKLRKCPKCKSLMQKIPTAMLLMQARTRGFGAVSRFSAKGGGLIVYPRRCVDCGYIELYSK